MGILAALISYVIFSLFLGNVTRDHILRTQYILIIIMSMVVVEICVLLQMTINLHNTLGKSDAFLFTLYQGFIQDFFFGGEGGGNPGLHKTKTTCLKLSIL